MVQRLHETGMGKTDAAWQGEAPWIILGCPRKFCLVPSYRWACNCYPLYSYQSRKLYRSLWISRRAKILPHSEALSISDYKTCQICNKT